MHRQVPAFALAVAACVASCGGEETSGQPDGSGVKVGFAEGTVTAAGKRVAVDGAAFDVSKAKVQAESSPGIFEDVQARPGQHAQFDFHVDREADTVRIEPQAVGQVTGVGAGIFLVLGQRVRINTNPGEGPVTVFDGYPSGLNDVRVGDAVEVHGLSRREATGSYVLQATRVNKQPTLPGLQRLSGVVTQLSAGASSQSTSFLLGEMRVVVPSGTEVFAELAKLQNGQTVTVFGLPGAAQFNASFVRIKTRANAGIDAYFGGTLNLLPGTTGSFELNGVPVRLGAAALAGFVPADLQYVQLRGNFDIDGNLDVTAVSLRGASGVDTELEISGPITSFNTSTSTALVRGFMVFMKGAQAQECFNGIGVGVVVSVKGQAVTGGIVASRVRCIN
jgi:hypothetical protein